MPVDPFPFHLPPVYFATSGKPTVCTAMGMRHTCVHTKTARGPFLGTGSLADGICKTT
jgi:hypothetical protein